ncbi:hypothetical protein IB277_33530 [Ensifer sp. ENS07]|uniref:hypothetical protein n=1 Tax=unclassified Ensifer TaxID=2633371 RepID=UPI0017841B38|nr:MULTISPECIES: hypothetical protein [unclassified Ensifer]MBD9507914.1 hypothetical protein [Ensifer sp. ENS10]MBD9641218.1 hypothetical protein [Ensifer sp. ENS07]
MDIVAAKLLLDSVAEVENGTRLELLRKREDCSVVLFMVVSDEYVASGVWLDISWEEEGRREGISRGAYPSPSAATDDLRKIGSDLMLGDFTLVHPTLPFLERAWDQANSQAYYDAFDVLMRHISSELEEEANQRLALAYIQ